MPKYKSKKINLNRNIKAYKIPIVAQCLFSLLKACLNTKYTLIILSTMQQEVHTKDYQNYDMLKQKKMTYKLKDVAINLIHKPKFMYPQFNLFQLQLNRFHALPEFAKLTQEIVQFNQELQNWKKNNIQVKNIFLTYHLYQNLFSRMKYTSSLILDRNEAKRSYLQIARWFNEQKPKIRNKAPQKEEGKLKPSLSERQTQTQIESLLVTNNTKRELKVYDTMARTTHKEFFPPKQRLLEYKRKQLLQGLNSQKLNQRRVSSVTTFSKGTHRYKGSFATTKASFFKTATQSLHTKQEEKNQPIVLPFQVNQQQQAKETPKQIITDPIAEDLGKSKQVQQEQILQKNIVQVVHEQDQVDAQQDVFSDEDNKQDKKFRKYTEDPSAQADMMAQEKIKDAKQSTLRRILREKEEAVRNKLQQLNIAQQMSNWGAIKGRQTADEHRKLQRMSLANQFKKLEFVPRTFDQRQSSRKRDIPQFQYIQRSKSSKVFTIQQQVQRIKINNALKTYSKYINHIQIKPIELETDEQQSQMRIMRATSLTSFCRQGKKVPFSSIVEKHGTESQNEEGFNYMNTIKDRLAKTAVSVQKRQILNALGVVNMDKLDRLSAKQVYPPQKNLLNNPFFPKHLYQTKPKKKKT